MQIEARQPTVLDLPSGMRVAVATQRWTPVWWAGAPEPAGLPRIWSRKPMVAVAGRPVCAELAVLSELTATGWQGVWVSAFGNRLRREWFPAPAFASIATAGAPPWAAEIFNSVLKVNGNTLGGFFDVFAWRHQGDVLFCEVKVGPDRIHANQRRFLASALQIRALSDFMIIEMPQPGRRILTARRAARPTVIPAEASSVRAATDNELLISPSGIAHFAGCSHKGSHPDYSRWATLSLPRAWERLGEGETLRATGGQRPGLVATSRCRSCVKHGPR